MCDDSPPLSLSKVPVKPHSSPGRGPNCVPNTPVRTRHIHARPTIVHCSDVAKAQNCTAGSVFVREDPRATHTSQISTHRRSPGIAGLPAESSHRMGPDM